VLGATREEFSSSLGRMEIELVRQVPKQEALGVYYVAPGGDSFNDVVRDIWYMPVALRDVDGNLLNVTPIYCTVKEL